MNPISVLTISQKGASRYTIWARSKEAGDLVCYICNSNVDVPIVANFSYCLDTSRHIYMGFYVTELNDLAYIFCSINCSQVFEISPCL